MSLFEPRPSQNIYLLFLSVGCDSPACMVQMSPQQPWHLGISFLKVPGGVRSMVINTRATNRLASVITKPTEMIGLIAASTRPIMSPTSEVAIGAYQVALATGPFLAIITAFPRVTSCPSARGAPRVCPHMCAQLDSLWRMLAGLSFIFFNSQRYRVVDVSPCCASP